MRNAIAAFAAHGMKMHQTLPPQTNGKVERFNRMLREEWAWARTYTSEAARQGCYPDFIEHCNHQATHGTRWRVTCQPRHQPTGLVQLGVDIWDDVLTKFVADIFTFFGDGIVGVITLSLLPTGRRQKVCSYQPARIA